jgi:hypothetical protein
MTTPHIELITGNQNIVAENVITPIKEIKNTKKEPAKYAITHSKSERKIKNKCVPIPAETFIHPLKKETKR